MTKSIEYKEQKPRFQSEFLDNAIKKENYESNFLGNVNIDSNICDLFLILYKNGHYNSIIVFGEDEQEYSSGLTFLFSDTVNKKVSGFSEIYKRAVESGLFVEKNVYIGHSEERNNLNYDAYLKTEYCQNKPKKMNLSDLYLLSDEEIDKVERKEDKELDRYKRKYLESGKKIPNNPLFDFFIIFDSKDEAIEYSRKDGYFEKHKSVSKEHSSAIGHKISSKFFKIYKKKELFSKLEKKDEILQELKSLAKLDNKHLLLDEAIEELYTKEETFFFVSKYNNECPQKNYNKFYNFYLLRTEINSLLFLNEKNDISFDFELKDLGLRISKVEKNKIILEQENYYEGDLFLSHICLDFDTLKSLSEVIN